jgi:hypothetical protein
MRSSVARYKRIALIVEHHAWLRSTLISLFEEMGYVVAAASNGIAALRLVTEVRPKVVVLGAALPELSGELVATELMALRHLSELQVVLASDLLSHVLGSPLQTSGEPRWRDQIDAHARRLSAPHPGAAGSRAPMASNKAGRARVLRPMLARTSCPSLTVDAG